MRPRAAFRYGAPVRLVVASVVALTAWGCSPALHCTTTTTVVRLDGGVFSCFRAEDCPRPASAFVCTNTADLQQDCIACEKSECLQYTPVACK